MEEVVFFDHNLRSEWTEAARNSPAHHVHTDFTHEAAARRVRALLGDAAAEAWLRGGAGHVAIVNVWRPTGHAVERTPLAFLDINTVQEEVDIYRIYTISTKSNNVNAMCCVISTQYLV